MIGARASRPALVTVLLAVGGVVAGAATDGVVASEESPCRVTSRLVLDAKLVCPFEAVEARIKLRASCPIEPDGSRAEIRSLRVIHTLPGGIRHSDSAQPLSLDRQSPTWRIEPFPSEGVTLTQRIRPIQSGSYSIGSDLRFSLIDDRGRSREQIAPPPAGGNNLTVSTGCYGQRQSAIFLPWVHQLSCSPQRRPADIVLAVDRSTSLGADGKSSAARHARAFLENVALHRDRVALLAFAQDVDVLASLGTDRSGLDQAIDALEPAAGTSIDRAIEAGVRLLGVSEHRRRILVLITDGVQTGPRGRSSVLAAAEAADEAGVTILTAAVGEVPNLTLLRKLGRSGQPVVVTGGFSGLGEAYLALGEQLACSR